MRRLDAYLPAVLSLFFLLAGGCTGRNADPVVVSRADGISKDAAIAEVSDPPSPDMQPGSEATTAIPAMQVVPTRVEFGIVWPGEVAADKVNVLNTGNGVLEIQGFKTTGSSSFAVDAWGIEVEFSGQTVQGIPLPDPFLVPPGETTSFNVHFEPSDDSPAYGKVVLLSNDPDRPAGHEVQLVGNEAMACMAVNPEILDFGVAKVETEVVKSVEVGSCGKKPLHISGVRLEEGSSPAFTIEFPDEGSSPGPGNPVVLAPGQYLEVPIAYAPTATCSQREDGSFVQDEAVLVIENDSYYPEKEVLIKGIGLEGDYPVAVISSTEPSKVPPQCIVHLFGDGSYSANGEIVKWHWSVVAPDYETSQFVPSATFPNPVYETNIAGVYRFELRAVDELGFESPLPAIYEVLVLPCCFGFTVELTWQTPGDSDPNDAGPGALADLDLHMLHPQAVGEDVDGDGTADGWFDTLFDCFWFNANPKSWGPGFCGLDGGPGLVEGGYGSQEHEAISYCMPAQQPYRIGVHYWDDHGFGTSLATVRVTSDDYYIFFEAKDMPLQHLDFWEVCTIDWSTTNVSTVATESGSPVITPNVMPPWGEM